MSDVKPVHPTAQPDSYERDEPRRPTRNVPPLLWIIVAALVVWFAVAIYQRHGADRTPMGGHAPQIAEDAAIMPAAPANGDAPATPGSVVNGAAQPAPDVH